MSKVNKYILLPLAIMMAAGLTACSKQSVKPPAPLTKASTGNISQANLASLPSSASERQVPPKSSMGIAFLVCPDPSLVSQNKSQSIWQDQGLYWSNASIKWGVGDNMEFMKAFISQQGSIECYYRWPNSNMNQPDSWLWMSIQLNPGPTEVVAPYGQHWQSSSKLAGMLCSSHLTKTCAYTVKNVTPSDTVLVPTRDSMQFAPSTVASSVGS